MVNHSNGVQKDRQTACVHAMLVVHTPFISTDCQLLHTVSLTTLLVLEEIKAARDKVERNIPTASAFSEHLLCAILGARSKERGRFQVQSLAPSVPAPEVCFSLAGWICLW